MSSDKFISYEDAKAAGCKCEWFKGPSIIRFDPDCPVLDQHRHPEPLESEGSD